MADPSVTRRVIHQHTRTLDGNTAAGETYRRRRRGLNAALEHAVESQDLDENPLKRLKTKRVATDDRVDPRVVVNHGQAATRRQTLYLLPDVEPTTEGLLSALDEVGLQSQGYQLAVPARLGVPALFAYGSAPAEADWCADARITTGLPVSFVDQRSGGVLVLAVDGQVYGITYGAGRWLLRDECKDQRFGLPRRSGRYRVAAAADRGQVVRQVNARLRLAHGTERG